MVFTFVHYRAVRNLVVGRSARAFRDAEVNHRTNVSESFSLEVLRGRSVTAIPRGLH